MFELFTGCRADGMDGEPDDNKIDEELRKIEPKLAAKKGPDGKITKPGLSIWPALNLRSYLICAMFQGLDLLLKLKKNKPEKRLSAKDALEHEVWWYLTLM